MPHYEYLCSACSEEFSMVLTLAEREKGLSGGRHSGGARKPNSSRLHSTRRPLRRDELQKCRAAGNPTRFWAFHVCLGC